jgi:HEAT repeat protein
VWGDLELITYDAQIDALGDLKAKDAADLLLKIFRHQYSWEGSAWRTKMEVLIALGKIGDERALPDAGRNTDSRSDWYIRQGALNYLIHINNKEARTVLQMAYQNSQDPEIALCLVQLGEKVVLPDVRNQLKKWLDNFDTGGWVKTDYWGIFYCVHALLIAEDTEALPELRRAFAMFKKPNSETDHYIVEASQGYTPRLLLDHSKAASLVSDLQEFLRKNGGVGN